MPFPSGLLIEHHLKVSFQGTFACPITILESKDSSHSPKLLYYISYAAEHFPPLPISTIFAPLEGEHRKSTREIEGSIRIVYTEWVVHSWTLCFLSIMLYWSKTFVLINLSCTACSLLKHCFWWSTNTTTILFLRGCVHRGSRYPFCLGAYNAVRTAQCMDALCSLYRTIFTKEHMPTTPKILKSHPKSANFPITHICGLIY